MKRQQVKKILAKDIQYDDKEAEFEKNINGDKITLSYTASIVNESNFKSFKNVYYTEKLESNYYKDVKYQDNKKVKINDFDVEYAVTSYTSTSDDLITVKILAQAEKKNIYPLEIEFNITTKDTKKATDYYSSVEKLLEDALDINAESE